MPVKKYHTEAQCKLNDIIPFLSKFFPPYIRDVSMHCMLSKIRVLLHWLLRECK